MIDNEECKIFRRIREGENLLVLKSTWQGYTYYKASFIQNEIDGQEFKVYIPLIFRRGVELEDRTTIVIKRGVENFKKNKKDPYNCIYTIFVSDFEIIDTALAKDEEAFNTYNSDLLKTSQEFNSYDLPF